jgi:hypothetical protein
MAYKVFTAGAEALAVDVNNYLMAQTVSRFPTAANRAANLIAPALNQLTICDDRPGQVQYWNGGAWVDQVSIPPLPIPAGFHLQSGNVVTTTDGFGSAVFTYPVPFAGQPVVVGTDATPVDANVAVFYWTNSQVGFNVRGLNDTPIANGLVRIMYIATGLR